ncbi:MAG: hypothetical protein GY861_09630 [bacterium]|nr:hypothetical protein [bacterium]
MKSQSWIFLDYVDSRGANRISEWLQAIPKGARVEFESLLDVIRPTKMPDRPQTGILHGECKGLFELIFKYDNVQYRPLFCYGPEKKDITILAGARKKNNRLIPPKICKTALNRKSEIQDRKRVTKHVRIK